MAMIYNKNNNSDYNWRKIMHMDKLTHLFQRVLADAQSLQAFLYTANFYYSPEDKRYIENYLSFDANSVQLIKDKNNEYK